MNPIAKIIAKESEIYERISFVFSFVIFLMPLFIPDIFKIVKYFFYFSGFVNVDIYILFMLYYFHKKINYV